MSTIDEKQLTEDTINLTEVIKYDEEMASPQNDNFDMNHVESVSQFQNEIETQERSILKIREIVQHIKHRNTVTVYLGALGVTTAIGVIATLYFFTRPKSSMTIFLSVLIAVISLALGIILAIEGYKFLQIRKFLEKIEKPLLETSAMNHREKLQSLEMFDKIKEQLNGITLLTTLIGPDVKQAALKFHTLRCVSYEDKVRIVELKEYVSKFKVQIEKEIDQDRRLQEEIVNVTTNQQSYIDELNELNDQIKSVPTLKNDFGISYERYNNLGGEKAEQAIAQEWKQRINDTEQALKLIQHEKDELATKLAELRQESVKNEKDAKKLKEELSKKQAKLEQDKQNLLKKIDHAQSDFEAANQNILETNQKLRELNARISVTQDEETRQQLLSQKEQIENQIRKHVNISEKAKNFIDTASVTDIDLNAAQIQADIFKVNQKEDERRRHLEQEINKIQNELNRRSRDVVQTEELLNIRQSQRQEALRPFQEQVEIMLNLNKKIREISERKRDEKPSLEAKIVGITQRLDNLIMEKSGLELKIKDDQQRVVLIEDEIRNLSNNFID